MPENPETQKSKVLKGMEKHTYQQHHGDLPRESGTIHGLASKHPGRVRRVDYMMAYLAWKGGAEVYAKNGNGNRSEVNAREWIPVAPYNKN